MVPNTVLAITGIPIPDNAARGLSETLAPIPAGNQLVRTVNGELIDLSTPEFFKYAVLITGSDAHPPALDGLRLGTLVTVDCITELVYLTSGGSPDRPVVPGSSRIDGAYTFYRPRLTMRVVDYQKTRDEWAARSGWSISFEEV